MPITIADAPDTLPKGAKTIYVGAFNGAYSGECKDEGKRRDECSARIAWAAVKNKYKQVGDKWVAKAAHVQVEFYIAKASLQADGTMRWLCVASDTNPDNRRDRTTLTLFRDWMDRVENDIQVSFLPSPRKPFLGLSHYPSLDGFGEAGLTDRMYIDGDQFKAGGFFIDNALGHALFDAIRDELAAIKRGDHPDLPIRISAAWWDIEHAHGDFLFRRSSLDDICPMCVEDTSKTFLKGQLDHFAATRVPINPRTSVVALEERSMAKVTRHDDAASIVDPDLADELERQTQERLEQRSDADAETPAALVIKADDEGDLVELAGVTCECLECGKTVTLKEGEHCPDTKCPECGGEMRRKERPGVGRADEEQAVTKKKKKDDWQLTKSDIRSLIALIDKELARRKKVKEKKAYVEMSMQPVNEDMSLGKLIEALFNSCPSRAGKTKSTWMGDVKSWIGSAATKSITGYRRRLVMVGTKMGMKFGKADVEMADEFVEQQTAPVTDMPDTWRPFGGATSISAAEAWLEAQEKMFQVYDSWGMFRAIMENILDDTDLTDKLPAVREAIAEFGDRVETIKSGAVDAFLVRAVVQQGEETMPEQNKDQVQDTQATERVVAETPAALDPGSAFWSAIQGLTGNVTLSRADMLKSAQTALETLASAVQQQINAVRPPAVDGEEMKAAVTAAVAEAMRPLGEQVALLLAKSQAAAQPAPAVPVQRSQSAPQQAIQEVVPDTGLTIPSNSLRALARRSVGLQD